MTDEKSVVDMDWCDIFSIILDSADFFDKRKNLITVSGEMSVQDFGDCYEYEIEYVKVTKPLPNDICIFLLYEYGIEIPNATGFYHFGWVDEEDDYCWYKVGDSD